MVQLYQSPVRVYKHPFELVMAAYMRRFPTCPLIPVFAGCEVLSNCTTLDGAETVTERRCKLNVEAPYLLKKMIGVDFVYFIQTNTLDRRKRRLSIEARNETFSTRVHVLEKCFYFVHPENPDWTCFEQMATLDVKSFFGLESTIEKLAMKQYSQNIAKGKEIIDHYLSEMEKEGITFIPVWKEVNIKPSDDLHPINVERLVVSKYDEEINFSPLLDTSHSAAELSVELEDSCTLHGLSSSLGLESEYIMRFLGNLTPLQESCLVQLRASIVRIYQGKVPSDAVLLRFLRARDFNVERAMEMLSSSLIWRKKLNVDNLLAAYEEPKAVKEFFPGGWHFSDKEGRPLYLLRLGQMDVKGLIRAIGEKGLLNLTLHICEEGLQLTEEATLEFGKPVSTWALLVDLDGLNMRHLWRPGIKALLNIIEVVENNYPETLGRLLFVRAPRVFPIIWTVVGTFIHEATRAKFLIYGGNDYQAVGGLVDYIPEKYIPDFLGGPCSAKVPEGGAVSKCFQYERDGKCNQSNQEIEDDGMYTRIELLDDEVHQVHITSEECGTVLTWDFDVIYHDVIFSVVKHKKLLKESEKKNLSVQSVLASEEEFRQVCREGESIQGSHVTRADGKWEYILCWKEASQKQEGFRPIVSSSTSELQSANNSDSHNQGDSSKTCVKYYVEKLASADYRGSRGSLLSGLSQFSSLSNLAASSSGTSVTGSICPSR